MTRSTLTQSLVVRMSDTNGWQEKRRTELLDDLARLEHEQWKSWAYSVMDTETLSKTRTDRWLKNHGKNWNDFTEDEKNQDREWAERVLWVLKKHTGIK